MRALVVSNMLAGKDHPERGSFVRDQVDALRELPHLSVELYEFPPGARGLLRAWGDLRKRYRGERFDVVHAHFGLTAWPALAVHARGRALTVHGTDLSHPRTRLLTGAVLPKIGLLGAVSESLVQQIPGARNRARAVVLPCGVDMQRFRQIPRTQAREELKLELDGRYLLFAADPTRPEKRYDRAQALAHAVGAELLALGGVEPERVPLFINASNAVVAPSEREGFGLAAVEALAVQSRGLGYEGMMVIHPSHIETVNRVFGPSQADIEQASRILAALDGAEAQGAGATTLDGAMVDNAMRLWAQQVLATAVELPR